MNSSVSSDVKEELKRGKPENQEWERLSEKHLSYFNLISASTSLDKHNQISSKMPQTFKFNISKIIKNKMTGNELIVYNTLKEAWKTVILDNFMPLKNPCKHHAVGSKSGYYFIYDNHGIIHVLFDCMQICELTLPDERLNPTLYVYEKNCDQSILFVAGGYILKSGGTLVLDSIAVFYLNFKQLSKLLKHEPLYYIKMKYPRMNPTIFSYRRENELLFVFMGGNSHEKLQTINQETKRKSITYYFDDANLFCETISFERVKDYIFKSDFTHSQIITSEESLLLVLNGNDVNKSKNEKLRFSFDEGAVIKLKTRKIRRKVPYIFSIGKKKNEIWFIDKMDFVEHKLYMFKSRQIMLKNNSQMFCRSMITMMGNDVFYFNNGDSAELKYKKMHFKDDFGSEANMVSCGKSGCYIF